ncbi:DUF2079 domain-containing protein [Catenulispora rubra]|uniref:DUF2079 domain-containing protein n=1 Tax=Catenulispora rubra TaxID=280293 RepID=UPI0018920517|nr:DUF2079 domain-containing protein [Catenulispora rubra]
MNQIENDTGITIDQLARIRAAGVAVTQRPLRDAPPDRRFPAALAAATALTYSLLALRLNRLYRTGGYDLGIFTQYAKAFADGRPPTSPWLAKGAALSQTGPNLFGVHFSPILVVLGPAYRLWPHTETLLLIQAALVASSVFVVARCAIGKLGSRSGCRIGVAYALSWGLQQLVGFDFHEVAFELPFMACALAAYLDGRHRVAAVWSVLLLLVKEDMGLTVIVLGLLLARRARRTGIAVSIIGAAVAAVVMIVVIPHFAATGGLGRLGPGPGPDADAGYGATLARPWLIPVKLIWPPVKPVTVFMVLAAGGFAAATSPLILAAVPTLLWRFTADTPSYWGVNYHYSAVLMPVTFLALVDALCRRQALDQPPPSTRLPSAVAAFAAALCTAFPLHNLATPGFWHTPPHVTAADAAVHEIPSGALVATTNNLAPHLVDRTTVYPLTSIEGIDDLPQPIDWIAADTTLPDLRTPNGKALLAQLATDGFQTISADDGILVLHRP